MANAERFPSQIKYIVGNEACERFSFYGMRSILVVFMTSQLLMTGPESKSIYHLFVSACYLLPLAGGFLADRFLGKYRTILYLSLFYCLGHLTLSLWENRTGIYLGLGLIAIGSGGIKPCVSAYVGDQFTEKNQNLISKVYDLFYFSVNFGSFFSTLLMPWTLAHYGSRLAFGIPGILMGIATLIFWLGRKQYVQVPPTGKDGAVGFMPIFLYCLTHTRSRQEGQGFWDVARAKFKNDEVEAAKAAASVFKVFVTVSIFWSLFDQTGSSWTLQATQMNPVVFGVKMEAAQMQAANPIFVMLLIPLFTFGIYRFAEKFVKVTPLRKMAAGMVIAALSFVITGMIQNAIDAGHSVSILWQIIPYLVLTASEVMVSITGLEFAYTQAPRSMKSTIMSFWLLTVFAGDLLDAVVSRLNVFQGASQFYAFAMMMLAVSVVFIWSATRYKIRSFVETPTSADAFAPST